MRDVYKGSIVAFVVSVLAGIFVLYLQNFLPAPFHYQKTPKVIFDVTPYTIGTLSCTAICITNNSSDSLFIESCNYNFEKEPDCYSGMISTKSSIYRKDIKILDIYKIEMGSTNFVIYTFNYKDNFTLNPNSKITTIFVTKGPNKFHVPDDWLTIYLYINHKNGVREKVPVEVCSSENNQLQKLKLISIVSRIIIAVLIFILIILGLVLKFKKFK